MCWSKWARNVTSRTILIVTSDSCNTMNIHLKWITLHQIVFNTICDIIFLHQTILLSVFIILHQPNSTISNSFTKFRSLALVAVLEGGRRRHRATELFLISDQLSLTFRHLLASFSIHSIFCVHLCVYFPHMNGEVGESCQTLPVSGWFCLLRFCGWLLSWSPAPRSTWPWRHCPTHQDVHPRAAHLPSPAQEPETLLEREHRSTRERPRPTSTKRDRLRASVGRVE